MSDDVQRYDIRSYDSGFPPIVLPRTAGAWVSYDDHDAAISALASRLAGAERRVKELEAERDSMENVAVEMRMAGLKAEQRIETLMRAIQNELRDGYCFNRFDEATRALRNIETACDAALTTRSPT